MKQKIKKILTILSIVSLSFSTMTFAGYSLPEIQTDFNKETSDYKQYLKNSAGLNSQQYQKIESKLDKLSVEKKQKFFRYLKDEKLLQKLISLTLGSDGNLSINGGDIVVKSTKTKATSALNKSLSYHLNQQRSSSVFDAYSTNTINILGIDVFQVRMDLKYIQDDDYNIQSIISHDIRVTRQLIPLLWVDFSGQSHYIHHNIAYFESNMNAYFAHNATQIPTTQAKIGMSVDSSGTVNTWTILQ